MKYEVTERAEILLKEEVKIVRISVRDLVEFVLREGDIDNRKIGMSDKDVMAMGGRLHRKIQRQMGSDYHAETAMKLQIPCGEFDLRVEGRADGVIIKGDTSEVIIDEIKGILRDLSLIEQPVNVHLAQAKCYAYIYAKQHSLREIGIQMTYCNLDTEEIRRFLSHYTYEALECWFEELISSYEKWARFQIKWEEKRNSSIRLVEFPFSYREGQREVAAAVYRTILRKKKLFLQAPTGVGKTISTLFPSVKAIGEGLGEKIFYLTAKTITRTVAEQAFRILGEQGLQMKVITLTAKEKICKCEETVDTHFEDGYMCEKCPNDYGDQYANVMACSSKQVYEFIEWVKQQPFYDNTTIVLSGDHLTMDSDFCVKVDEEGKYDRRTYTAYINSAVNPVNNMKRTYTTMDNFPTTLAAMGVKIEGNRLGLGTNLFSEELTLMESVGEEELKAELKKKSEFLQKVSGIDKNNETVLIRGGKMEGACIEAEVGSDSIKVNIEEINPAIKEKLKTIVLAVWTEEGQRDLQWIEAEKISDNQYEVSIKMDLFNNAKGKYYIDVRAVEFTDVEYVIGSTECKVE